MRFGRKPRQHNPLVPKLTALRKSVSAPVVLPVAVNNMQKLPQWLDMYHNDILGDCVEAAAYHSLQIWSANANPPIDTQPDVDAVKLYSLSSGYVPGDPNTDQGSDIQTVLTYWLATGIPHGASTGVQQLSAFVEVDERSLPNIKQTIYEGGLCFIGFNVPAFFDTNAAVWDVNPTGDNTIVDGHAVVLTGYDDTTGRFRLISWGQEYLMSYNFFLQFCDEAYVLADKEFIEATGKTPLGLTLADLEDAMQALKAMGGSWVHHRRHRRARKRFRRWLASQS